MARFCRIFGFVIFCFGLLSMFVSSVREIALISKNQSYFTYAHLLIGIALMVYGFVFAKQTVTPTISERNRAVRFFSGSTAYILVFLGIIGALNFLAGRYNKKIDLTEQGVYSLAPQSSDIIAKLQKPLRIVGFDIKVERQVDNLRDLLALYKGANPSKVSTEFINPRSKPQMVEQLGMKGGNLVYLEYGEGEHKGVTRLNEATEESITNAIAKLTGGDAKKVYYLTGHGEPQLTDANAAGLKGFADAMKDEHFDLEELALAQSKTKGVPSDAAALMLVAPKGPFLPGEQDALVKYVDEGGKLVVLTDPRGSADVRSLTEHFGVKVENDVALDVVTQLFAGPSLALQFTVNNFGAHDITRKFSKNDVIIVNNAASITTATKGDADTTYTDLLKTSENGWGEKNLTAIFDSQEPTAEFGEGDIKGPVALAVAYQKKLKSADGEPARYSKLVVFGDSDWMTNALMRYPAHRDLALNTVGWLSGQESSISIRPRTMRTSPTPITWDAFKSLLRFGFLVPEFIVLLGLFVWWRRRAQSSPA